jgi:hypothetical protein
MVTGIWRVYDVLGMTDFNSPEFDDAVVAAYARARQEALTAGVPVFYVDGEGRNIMENPDGSRFEIEWVPGAPSGRNFKTIRELSSRAA